MFLSSNVNSMWTCRTSATLLKVVLETISEFFGHLSHSNKTFQFNLDKSTLFCLKQVANQALQSLHKWWACVDLDLFYDNIKFGEPFICTLIYVVNEI